MVSARFLSSVASSSLFFVAMESEAGGHLKESVCREVAVQVSRKELGFSISIRAMKLLFSAVDDEEDALGRFFGAQEVFSQKEKEGF